MLKPSPKSIQRLLGESVFEQAQQRINLRQQLQERWQAAAGPQLSARSLCLSLSDGQLTIVVQSAAWANHARLREKQMLAYLRQFPDLNIQSLAIQVNPTLIPHQ